MFRDEGRSIAVLDTSSERAIGVALATAQAKFGNTVTLVGSEDFKLHAVAAAVKNNLSVRFSDPDLNQLREQMYAQKMNAERRQVTAERLAAEKENLLEKSHEQVRERQKDFGPSR